MERYKVIKVLENGYRAQICKDGKASKFGEAKIFTDKWDAYAWARKRCYEGMSFRYEIEEVK